MKLNYSSFFLFCNFFLQFFEIDDIFRRLCGAGSLDHHQCLRIDDRQKTKKISNINDLSLNLTRFIFFIYFRGANSSPAPEGEGRERFFRRGAAWQAGQISAQSTRCPARSPRLDAWRPSAWPPSTLSPAGQPDSHKIDYVKLTDFGGPSWPFPRPARPAQRRARPGLAWPFPRRARPGPARPFPRPGLPRPGRARPRPGPRPALPGPALPYPIPRGLAWPRPASSAPRPAPPGLALPRPGLALRPARPPPGPHPARPGPARSSLGLPRPGPAWAFPGR